jgi:hypothetical protein
MVLSGISRFKFGTDTVEGAPSQVKRKGAKQERARKRALKKAVVARHLELPSETCASGSITDGAGTTLCWRRFGASSDSV